MGTVTRLETTNEPGKEQVLATLHEAIQRVQECDDPSQFTRAIVLLLDTSGDSYNVSFFNAGMSMSECVALVEVGKLQFLNQMGFVPDPCVCYE